MSIIRIPRTQGKILHSAKGQPYHEVNSLPGLRLAVEGHYEGIDLDVNASSDGVIFATHWGKPMLRDGFHDPLGILPRDTDMHEMTAEQVRRLRTADGYQIRRVSTLIRGARRLGLTVEVEAKPSPPLYRPGPWKRLAEELDGDTKRDLLVKVLMDLGPHPENRLKAAHEAGFRTCVIVQGHRIDPAWEAFIDTRRG
jgi:glycerophosphoryl diester phosphodiesterase